MNTTYALTADDVHDAATRIASFVHRTPTITNETISRRARRPIYFKCENLQRTGSFKYRGATNAVQKLSDAVAARGVVTHSSGNHAQALAKAAAVRGISATVVMPRTAATIKKQAVLDYGATMIECEPTLTERERTAAEIVSKTGGTLIPPFDHPDVMAGQGTLALELLEDAPALHAILVPVGGGGMLSGVTIAAKATQPNIKIFGCEPLAADDASRSFATKTWVPQTAPQTIADGLMTSLGQLTWPIIRDHVDEVFTVTEEEIVSAMRLVWERMKLIIEPSAAVGVAVALSPACQAALPAGVPIGVVLCGGNVTLDRLYW